MGTEKDGNVQKEETKKKRKSLDEQLADSKLRTQQLEALKRKRDAREKDKLNKAERAKDTRRKVLLGAIVLGRVARKEWSQENLDDLTQELTRDDDRALFGLPPIGASSPGT